MTEIMILINPYIINHASTQYIYIKFNNNNLKNQGAKKKFIIWPKMSNKNICS